MERIWHFQEWPETGDSTVLAKNRCFEKIIWPYYGDRPQVLAAGCNKRRETKELVCWSWIGIVFGKGAEWRLYSAIKPLSIKLFLCANIDEIYGRYKIIRNLKWDNACETRAKKGPELMEKNE